MNKMTNNISKFIFTFLILFANQASYSAVLIPVDSTISLPEGIVAPEDVSAVSKFEDFLIIGSDEGGCILIGCTNEDENYIQLLGNNTDGSFKIHKNILLFKGNKRDGEEMDIEGVAVDNNYVYVIGSHSSKRPKIKENKKYKKNRKKFSADKIKPELNRDWLYRLQLDSNGEEISRDEPVSLRDFFSQHYILKAFKGIPSKENGIDIEGIAIKEDWVYLGFRGPVFRGNFAPILKFKFNDLSATNEILFVQLGGLGIRELVSVNTGFLILAGAVTDAEMPFLLYYWDGKDQVPGENRAITDLGKINLLGEIKPPKGGKAEGLVVLEESATSYKVIIAYDGVNNKNHILQSFEILKPEP